MSLEARDVSYRYDPKSWVFQQMNMQVKQGEVVGLWGPSGCGKTSLGRILAGYAEPVAGQVLLDGNPLPRTGVCPVRAWYSNIRRKL